MVSDAVTQDLRFARALGLLPLFERAARETGVPLEILLAVASRESGIGRTIVGRRWIGDSGYGVGIMQIDKRYHPEFTQRVRTDDHAQVIQYAARYLRKLYDQFRNWRYAVAAYNAGPTRVRQVLEWGYDPDDVTTGRNYSDDVMRRAEVIRSIINPNPFRALVPAAIMAGAVLFSLAMIRHA